MKIKMRVVSCTHETRHGVDHYTKPVKKNENVQDVIDAIMKDCDYDENAGNEYFESDLEEVIIDTDDYEIIEE